MSSESTQREGEAGPGSEPTSTKPARTREAAFSVGAAVLIAAGIGLYVLHKHPMSKPTPEAAAVASGAVEECCGPPDEAPRNLEAVLARAKELNAAGTQLADQGQLDAAIIRFQEALDLCPGLAPAHCNLGGALYKKGMLREALQHLTAAVQIDPDIADAHFSLGIIRMAQENYTEAAQQFKLVIHLKPDDVDAQSNLALAFDRQGKIGEAIAHYREVVRLCPDNLPVARQLAWHLATCPDDAVRNADEAVTLAERVVKAAGSRVPVVLDTLAAAYANAGRYDQAIQIAENARDDAKELWKTSLARSIEGRLELYRAHKPFRDQTVAAKE